MLRRSSGFILYSLLTGLCCLTVGNFLWMLIDWFVYGTLPSRDNVTLSNIILFVTTIASGIVINLGTLIQILLQVRRKTISINFEYTYCLLCGCFLLFISQIHSSVVEVIVAGNAIQSTNTATLRPSSHGIIYHHDVDQWKVNVIPKMPTSTDITTITTTSDGSSSSSSSTTTSEPVIAFSLAEEPSYSIYRYEPPFDEKKDNVFRRRFFFSSAEDFSNNEERTIGTALNPATNIATNTVTNNNFATRRQGNDGDIEYDHNEHRLMELLGSRSKRVAQRNWNIVNEGVHHRTAALFHSDNNDTPVNRQTVGSNTRHIAIPAWRPSILAHLFPPRTTLAQESWKLPSSSTTTSTPPTVIPLEIISTDTAIAVAPTTITTITDNNNSKVVSNAVTDGRVPEKINLLLHVPYMHHYTPSSPSLVPLSTRTTTASSTTTTTTRATRTTKRTIDSVDVTTNSNDESVVASISTKRSTLDSPYNINERLELVNESDADNKIPEYVHADIVRNENNGGNRSNIGDRVDKNNDSDDVVSSHSGNDNDDDNENSDNQNINNNNNNNDRTPRTVVASTVLDDDADADDETIDTVGSLEKTHHTPRTVVFIADKDNAKENENVTFATTAKSSVENGTNAFSTWSRRLNVASFIATPITTLMSLICVTTLHLVTRYQKRHRSTNSNQNRESYKLQQERQQGQQCCNEGYCESISSTATSISEYSRKVQISGAIGEKRRSSVILVDDHCDLCCHNVGTVIGGDGGDGGNSISDNINSAINYRTADNRDYEYWPDDSGNGENGGENGDAIALRSIVNNNGDVVSSQENDGCYNYDDSDDNDANANIGDENKADKETDDDSVNSVVIRKIDVNTTTVAAAATVATDAMAVVAKAKRRIVFVEGTACIGKTTSCDVTFDLMHYIGECKLYEQKNTSKVIQSLYEANIYVDMLLEICLERCRLEDMLFVANDRRSSLSSSRHHQHHRHHYHHRSHHHPHHHHPRQHNCRHVAQQQSHNRNQQQSQQQQQQPQHHYYRQNGTGKVHYNHHGHQYYHQSSSTGKPHRMLHRQRSHSPRNNDAKLIVKASSSPCNSKAQYCKSLHKDDNNAVSRYHHDQQYHHNTNRTGTATAQQNFDMFRFYDRSPFSQLAYTMLFHFNGEQREPQDFVVEFDKYITHDEAMRTEIRRVLRKWLQAFEKLIPQADVCFLWYGSKIPSKTVTLMLAREGLECHQEQWNLLYFTQNQNHVFKRLHEISGVGVYLETEELLTRSTLVNDTVRYAGQFNKSVSVTAINCS